MKIDLYRHSNNTATQQTKHHLRKSKKGRKDKKYIWNIPNTLAGGRL